MSENISLKQEADRLLKIPGNVKGVVFQTHYKYILYRTGEEGVKTVEAKLEELGHPLKFKEIKSWLWYSEGLDVLIFLILKDIFNWDDSDIFDMGTSAPKYSFIVGTLLKTFISPKKFFEETPKYWEKHYSFGQMEALEINEDQKYATVRIKDYNFHPISCIYFKGYFTRIGQFIIKTNNFQVEEKKCVHRGDTYHEFLLTWE